MAVTVKTDTPRTDAVATVNYVSQYEYSAAMTKHARTLERELLAATVSLGALAAKRFCGPEPQIERTAPAKNRKDAGSGNRFEALSNDDVMERLRKYGCRGAIVNADEHEQS